MMTLNGMVKDNRQPTLAYCLDSPVFELCPFCSCVFVAVDSSMELETDVWVREVLSDPFLSEFDEVTVWLLRVLAMVYFE